MKNGKLKTPKTRPVHQVGILFNWEDWKKIEKYMEDKGLSSLPDAAKIRLLVEQAVTQDTK